MDEGPQSIDGDIATARFNHPSTVAVASDGTIFVGEGGQRVRQIRDGVVKTIWRGEVYGLMLDENLLYVTAGHQIITITIGTLAEEQEARYYPALQTWALMQEEDRTESIPAAAADESAEEARARHTLRLLMDCPIPDILVRTLRFLYN